MSTLNKRGRPPAPTSAPAVPGLRLLGYKDLLQKGIPWSRSEIRRKEAKGRFPMHVTLGEGERATIAWVESEIDDFIREKMRARPVMPNGTAPITTTKSNIHKCESVTEKDATASVEL
jgi:predicted DNA-binding transcriptional regulator AlpA